MEKYGPIFTMAVGFFLIAVSPLYENKFLNIITGLSLVVLGFYYYIKNKKNKK